MYNFGQSGDSDLGFNLELWFMTSLRNNHK